MTTLELSLEKAVIIADLLNTKVSVLQNRFDRYAGILESGEATEKQQDLFWDAKNELETVKEFIEAVETEQYYEKIRIENRKRIMNEKY
ncbi:MAG: hypothetical protein ACI392_00300 [Paludibacteraceae bacterium]